MNDSEVLNKAADLIEERGWTTGNDGRMFLCNESMPLCLEGGLAAALGLSDWVGGDGFFQISMGKAPAAASLRDYLQLPKYSALWEWNDEWDPDTLLAVRTATEVIEALRAAAIIAAVNETDVRVVTPLPSRVSA